MRRARLWLLHLTSGAVALTAGAQPAAAQALRSEDVRIQTIAHRMAIAATPWCRSLTPLPGWVLHHLAEYDRRTREDLIAVYAMDRGPGIIGLAPGSAAERAGLRPGDTLTSINGVALGPLSSGPGLPRGQSREPGTKIDALIERELARGPAKLGVSRDGEAMEVTLTAPLACPARIRIAEASSRNAFADGAYAVFSARLVAETKSEDELAALVGHELAHNFLGHRVEREATGDRPRKREQEAEADAFSLRLMAVSGYDPQAALNFWGGFLSGSLFKSLGLGAHYSRERRIDDFRTGIAEMSGNRDAVVWNGVSVPRPAAR